MYDKFSSSYKFNESTVCLKKRIHLFSLLETIPQLNMKNVIVYFVLFLFSISSIAAEIELEWKMKNDTNVAGYSITMWLESGLSVVTRIGKFNSFKVTTLSEGKKYVFQITPLTKDGANGPVSNYIVYNVPPVKSPEILDKPELRIKRPKNKS